MDFSNLSVLVIGDVCLDVTTEGESNRLSPEAPVPVILNPVENYSLGMAANVAYNLHNLGANVHYIFAYGDDKYGEIFSSLIKDVAEPHIIETGGKTFTTVKNRIMANNHQIGRIDFESSVDEPEINSIIDTLKELADNAIYFDLIIISDYNKGIITKDSWSKMRPLLEQLSYKFFVDTKKLDVLNYYEGMYIFPNRKEMQAIMDYNNCKTRNDLRVEMNLDFIVETASEEGAFIYKNDGKIIHCPVFKSAVIDICGAGDTFMAAFALYYAKFQNKIRALEFANYCCSKVIQKQGTTPITISEVMDFDSKSI